MAGYPCTGCDGAEQAVVLVTPLSGADTMAIGPNCLPVTWCGLFAGVTGLDPEQLWDAAVALNAAQAAELAPAEAGAGAPPDGAQQPPGGDGAQAPARPPARSQRPPDPIYRRPRTPASRESGAGS